MKFTVRKNISDDFNWSVNLQKVVDTYSKSDSDAEFIVTHYEDIRNRLLTVIDSEYIVNLMRSTLMNSDNEIVFPKHIPAPIGAISLDVLRNSLHEQVEAVILQRAKTGIKYLEWDKNSLENALNSAVQKVSPNKSQLTYHQGIVKSLMLMMDDKWHTKTLYMFFAINSFLGSTESETTLKEFIENNDEALTEEFNTFNGTENSYTEKLVQSWGMGNKWTYLYFLTPYGQNISKAYNLLETLTADQFRSLLDKDAFKVGSTKFTISSQLTKLKSVIQSAKSNVATMSNGEVVSALVETMFTVNRSQGNPNYGAISMIPKIVEKYASIHSSTDVYSNSIVSYLKSHADKLTLEEVITVLYASYKGTSIISDSGSPIVAKSIISRCLSEISDPIMAVKFIANVVMDYNGPLPTSKMWNDLIDRDKENPSMHFPPAIVFSMSGASRNRNIGTELTSFRSTMKRQFNGNTFHFNETFVGK